MIIVKLWGGLCNQMFQYAYGLSLAERFKDKLTFDTEFYRSQPRYVNKRNLELCEEFKLTNFSVVERPKKVSIFQNRIISNIVRRINNFHLTIGNNTVYIKERQHKYTDKPYYDNSKINYYDGYWQSEKYFEAIRETIKKEFAFNTSNIKKNKEWLIALGNDNSVAIHIRRGDMVGKNEGYSENDIQKYYISAIEYFVNNTFNPCFVVFSDDINWCKKWLSGRNENYVYRDGDWTGCEDLAGISLCKHGIMSQSTFSWWGNWLGETSERIVVAPKGKYLNDEFIPERWLRL